MDLNGLKYWNNKKTKGDGVGFKLFLIVLFLVWSPISAASEKITVQLRWHHQFQFAGYYAALEKGFYASSGLSVELKAIEPGMSPLREVVEGRADFSQSGVGLLVDNERGENVTAIAATFQNSPLIFLSTSKTGVSDISSLRGKRVMLNPGNHSLELLILLNTHGLSGGIERLDSSYRLLDLVEGKTDTFNGYASNEPYKLERLGETPVVIDPKDYGLDFYGDVIFSRTEFVQRKPEVVEAFRQATLRGWEYAMSHPEEIIALIIERYGSTKSKDHLRFEANALREMMMLNFVEIGHMNESRWRRNAYQLKSLGLLEGDVDFSRFLYQLPEKSDFNLYLPWLLLALVIVSITLFLLLHFIQLNKRLGMEINRRREAEKSALYKAMHDPLTNLPNRYLFQDRFEQLIRRKKRDDITSTLIFIDLDNFKQINDKFGHDEGDQLLVGVGKVLEECLREGDTCARIAGDEFILLLNECSSEQHARDIGERIVSALAEYFADADPTHLVSASLGVLIIDEQSNSKDLYKKADTLMYQAKKAKGKHIEIKRLSEF